jgi:hypothetical protein
MNKETTFALRVISWILLILFVGMAFYTNYSFTESESYIPWTIVLVQKYWFFGAVFLAIFGFVMEEKYSTLRSSELLIQEAHYEEVARRKQLEDEQYVMDAFTAVASDDSDSLDHLFADNGDDGAEELIKETDKSNEILKEKLVQMLKKIALVSVAILIGINVFSSVSHNKNLSQESLNKEKNELQEKNKETAIQEEQKKKLESEMLEKYNALNFNEENFNFTEDIQNEPNKTFLFKGRVYDIFKNGDDFFVKIDDWYGNFGIFKASEEQVRYMREKTDEYGTIDDLLLVVKVSDASKSLFETKVEIDGDDSWTYNQPSDGFLLKGTTIDVKKP